MDGFREPQVTRWCQQQWSPTSWRDLEHKEEDIIKFCGFLGSQKDAKCSESPWKKKKTKNFIFVCIYWNWGSWYHPRNWKINPRLDGVLLSASLDNVFKLIELCRRELQIEKSNIIPLFYRLLLLLNPALYRAMALFLLLFHCKCWNYRTRLKCQFTGNLFLTVVNV